MKRLLLKIGFAFLMGLAGIFLVLALMIQLETIRQVAYAAGPRYVAPSGSDSGNVCATLASPCATIQHAVDMADPGDVIKVAAGVYTGVNSYGGLSQTVYLSKSVSIQGGYTPAFSEPPNPVANPTTLDAQGQGRVIYITGTVAPSLEGLRIINGNAANLAGTPWGNDAGGGIYVITAAPVFSRNQIIDNTAADGGGMFLYDSQATLFGNTIMNNTASSGSGGGFILYNTAQLIDGRVIWDGPATVTNNIIMTNTASILGGGGLIFYSDAVLIGNSIASNQALQGGGLYVGESYPVFENNQIFNNEAVEGGGLQLVESKVYLTNDILVYNSSLEKGSGLYLENTRAYGQHLTIASNSGGDGSGFHMSQGSGVLPSEIILTNTIIASHTLGITLTAGTTASLKYTLWYGNSADWAGSGTITASNNYTGNPAFLNPTGGNYHLGSTSAAINKGVDAGVTFDIDGQIRDGIPDLGADEFLTMAPTIVVDGGSIWAANSETTIRLLAHNPVQGSFRVNLYDGDGVFVQTVIANTPGNIPIPWIVPDLAALGKSSCNVLIPKVCMLRSINKNGMIMAEAQVKINQPSIILNPPADQAPYLRGEVVTITLSGHTPGKQYLIKIQGQDTLTVTRIYTSPITDELGNADFQWLIEGGCSPSTGWPGGFYKITTHPIEQPSHQIATKQGIEIQSLYSPYLTVKDGDIWLSGSTIDIRIHQHRPITAYYLEFNGGRIPTPAADDTVKTDVCGNAVVTYTIPATTTSGNYRLRSFDQASHNWHAVRTITVIAQPLILIEGGQLWFPGATVTFRLYHHLPNTPYQIWLDRNGPQATLLGTFISNAQGAGSLTYTLPASFPLKSEPGYIVQSYPQASNTPEASTGLELILPLALHKTAPVTTTSGLPLTYTLRVTNAMPFSLTHLVLTDTLPTGASYITGGIKVGQVVSWTLSSLSPGATSTKTFVVTATHSLTNFNYAIRTGEGARVKGTTPVVTLIEGNEINKKRLYLPLLVKDYSRGS